MRSAPKGIRPFSREQQQQHQHQLSPRFLAHFNGDRGRTSIVFRRVNNPLLQVDDPQPRGIGDSKKMMEGRRRQSFSRGGGTTSTSTSSSFAKRWFLSKRKRDVEKKRLDLCKAMRDSSAERLASVISSARTEFGDRLHDLCSDAERVLQRLLQENGATMSMSSGTNHRKVTLRERLLLADCESAAAAPAAATVETCSAASTVESCNSLDNSSMIQAVLTLVRPQHESGSSNSGTTPSTTLGSHLQGSNGNGGGGQRRLLSALLWEERNVSEQPSSELGWLAFEVSLDSSTGIHSRTQSLAVSEMVSEVNPESSAPRPADEQQNGTVPETPMRVSLMSLLSEAEESGGSFIFMNRLVHHNHSESSSSPPRTSKDQQGLEQTCCVCMGYQKGAAFIPCGHTFCRKCCKELRAARGTCPLCNKEIDDILNLY